MRAIVTVPLVPIIVLLCLCLTIGSPTAYSQPTQYITVRTFPMAGCPYGGIYGNPFFCYIGSPAMVMPWTGTYRITVVAVTPPAANFQVWHRRWSDDYASGTGYRFNTSVPLVGSWIELQTSTFDDLVFYNFDLHRFFPTDFPPPENYQDASITFRVEYFPPRELPAFSVIDVQVPIDGVRGSLRSPAPVQVVFDPRLPANVSGPVDVVLGKSTAFFVGVHVNDRNMVPSRGVRVEVQFGSNAPFAATVMPQCPTGQTTNCFNVNGEATAVINPGFAPPTAGSGIPVIATVNPAGPAHIDEANSSPATQTTYANVISTGRLKLVYVPISGCLTLRTSSCYGTLTAQFPASISDSNAFLRRTYPVANEGVIASTTMALPIGLNVPYLGMLADLTNVAAQAAIVGGLTNAPGSRGIGIVPKDYFLYHLSLFYGSEIVNQVTGLTYPFVPHSIVQEGWDTVVAHELGHQFGLRSLVDRTGEEYNTRPPGNPASGFWLDGPGNGSLVENAVCFMGKFGRFSRPPDPTVWVENADYGRIFMQLAQTVEDPEVLHVTAILHKSGAMDLRRWDVIKNGLPSITSPGEYEMSLLDYKGAVIQRVPFSVGFKIHADPVGELEVDAVPIAIAIPYSANAGSVQLKKGLTVLATVGIATKTLADAINSIPDSGYINNPAQRRNTLLNKVGALQLDLSTRQFTGALQKLRNDVRVQLNQWLRDRYEVASPLEFTKAQVLGLVDDLIVRLTNQAQ